MSTRDAYERQVGQLPAVLRTRECGLVEVGRRHADDFDAGHEPSGGGVQRVLAELRRLAAAELAAVRERAPSGLDELRDRRERRGV